MDMEDADKQDELIGEIKFVYCLSVSRMSGIILDTVTPQVSTIGCLPKNSRNIYGSRSLIVFLCFFLLDY